MRTLNINLNSKEIGYKVQEFIYSLRASTVTEFPRPSAGCPTPHLEVRYACSGISIAIPEALAHGL